MPTPRVPGAPLLPRLLPLLSLLLVAACDGASDAAPAARPSARTAVASADRPSATPIPVAFDPTTWRPPTEAEIPTDSLGASIRRGLALVRDTPDSLPAYAPGRIACTNCHLDGGREPNTAPMAGAFARYPKYMTRNGAVVGIADRVNYCFTRSLAGRRLPHESREMEDIVAYLAFLSRGVPVGAGQQLPGADGQPKIPGGEALAKALPGDSARGAGVYASRCASCHGADGAGATRRRAPGIPALWGARSYAVGASMARQERAASFIWRNMPLGQGSR